MRYTTKLCLVTFSFTEYCSIPLRDVAKMMAELVKFFPSVLFSSSNISASSFSVMDQLMLILFPFCFPVTVIGITKGALFAWMATDASKRNVKNVFISLRVSNKFSGSHRNDRIGRFLRRLDTGSNLL